MAGWLPVALQKLRQVALLERGQPLEHVLQVRPWVVSVELGRLDDALVTLPGYFRPTKLWDILVVDKGQVIESIEIKWTGRPILREQLQQPWTVQTLERETRPNFFSRTDAYLSLRRRSRRRTSSLCSIRSCMDANGSLSIFGQMYICHFVFM